MRIILIYHPFIPVCMGSGSSMRNPLASIHWSFSLKVRDDWGFQVNPLCRHDITPPSGNEGYVCNQDITCAHQSLSFFWISCDCFGTFMQLIVRVLSLRSRVIHGFVTEPWYSRHVWVLCERAASSVLVPCFVLERGVRIPALMSWISCLGSDARAPRSVSLCECACIRVISCAVWHVLFFLHMAGEVFAGHVLVFLFCVSTWLLS